MKKTIHTSIVTACLTIAATVTVYAQTGSLDLTFGFFGKKTTAIGLADDGGYSVALQTDGKIVVAGYTYNGTNDDVALARYNSDATVDTIFGSGGVVTTAIGSASDVGNSVAIQSDGKIVVAGYSFNGTDNDFALIRYNSNGSLDNTFGTGGIVTTDFGSSMDVGSSIVIQSDGKIVVAGNTDVNSTADFAVIRYNSNGTLDNTFGTGGKVSTPVGSGADGGQSVALQTDGKIVVAGYSIIGINPDFAIVRYNSNGTLDNTFGTGGEVTTAIGSTDDEGYSVAMQSDGKIVVAGISNNGSDYDFAIARYNTNGSLDATFSSDGKVTTPIGSAADGAFSVTIQSDGKLVLAGYSSNGTDNDFALARYNSNGSLDTAFSNDGILTTAILTADDAASAVVIRSDGKIVVVGAANNGQNYDFALVQYNSNGTLDNMFGSGGKETIGLGSVAAYAQSVVIQPDGKIVVVGTSYNTSYDFALVRCNSDGSLDNTFGTGGKVITDIGSSFDYARSAALQVDGKIVVVGESVPDTDYDFALARYKSDGNLDSTFSSDGIVTTSIGNFIDNAFSVAIQTDGKIVAAGGCYIGSYYDFALVRYNMNGTLDNTFGAGGKVTTPIGNTDDFGLSVAIQPDDKIVVGGSTDNGLDYDFALVRYTTGGLLDNTFGAGGKVTFDFGSTDDIGNSVAIQSDGKIVLAGGSDASFALARFNSNGTLDNAFGSNGKVMTTIGNSGSEAYSVGFQNDGKIVVAGISSSNGARDFTLARYNSNGTLDTTFSADGKVTTDFDSTDDASSSFAIQNDGRIVVAGFSENNFAIARYNAVCYPATFSQNVTITTGQSVTVGTHLYTTADSSGTYTDTLVSDAVNGCDSIVTTHLSVITTVNTIAQNTTIKVYPNPFSDELLIKGTKEKGEIIIFGVIGKEIIRQKSLNAETKINTAFLTSGFYLLCYTEENKTVNIKLAKY